MTEIEDVLNGLSVRSDTISREAYTIIARLLADRANVAKQLEAIAATHRALSTSHAEALGRLEAAEQERDEAIQEREEFEGICAGLMDAIAGRVKSLDRIDSERAAPPPCSQCGGPHPFDTTIQSSTWNNVIRAQGLPEYLCATCIVRQFTKAGMGFAATLWGDGFNGERIEVVVRPIAKKA